MKKKDCEKCETGKKIYDALDTWEYKAASKHQDECIECLKKQRDASLKENEELRTKEK